MHHIRSTWLPSQCQGVARPACSRSLVTASSTRRHVDAAAGLYSFASASEPRQEGARRNRGLMKKEARQVADVVQGLCNMTDKQLKAVSSICGEEVVTAVQMAMRIDRRNQARKRQEQLIAKLLRMHLDDKAMDKVLDAVTLSRTSSNSWVDREMMQVVDNWREGLLAGDQAVLQEVLAVFAKVLAQNVQLSSVSNPHQPLQISSTGSSAADNLGGLSNAAAAGGMQASRLPSVQEFRALIRQCQQAVQEVQGLQAALVASPLQQPGTTAAAKEDADAEGLPAGASSQAAYTGRHQSSRSDVHSSTQPVAQQQSLSFDSAIRRRKLMTRSLNNVLKQLAPLALAG